MDGHKIRPALHAWKQPSYFTPFLFTSLARRRLVKYDNHAGHYT